MEARAAVSISRPTKLSTGSRDPSGPRGATEARALELFARYAYPSWLRRHSLAVGRIADVLARAHADGGASLDAGAVALGAYLHDIGKSPRFAGDPREHNELSASALRAEGLGHLAELARRHPVYAPLDPALVPRDLAERIVFYADRRADLSVVSLADRIAGQARRHPEHAAQAPAELAAAREIERVIFSGLRFSPDDLASLVG
jgi:putative nucleotidyltransferase with HDIG domain